MTDHMTIDQYDRLVKGKSPALKRSKYGAKKTEVDGTTFDSRLEADRYEHLRLLEMAGEIVDLELQPKFELLAKFEDQWGTKHRAINYVADFRYQIVKTGEIIVEDAKGMETRVFKLKAKLFAWSFPHLRLVIVNTAGG